MHFEKKNLSFQKKDFEKPKKTTETKETLFSNRLLFSIIANKNNSDGILSYI